MTSNSSINPDSPDSGQQADPGKQSLLATALSAAVPLHILGFCQHGGPTDEDLTRVKSYQKDLCEHGEDLFFRSKKPSGSAERFNQTAEAIAVLSFCPGGITIFGTHYDGQEMCRRYTANQNNQREVPPTLESEE